MKINKKIYSCLLVCGVIVASGCSSLKPQESPQAIKTETTFTGSTDSASIAQIKWRDFFGDPLLVALIDTTLQNNFDLKKAVQRIEMAQASLMYRQGALLPVINAEGSGGIRKFGEYTMDGIGNYDTNFSENIGPEKHIPKHLPDYFLGLRSSWELDIWGKLRKQKEAAVLRFFASEKGKQLITTSLVAQVGRLYYELLALDNELAIVRKNKELQGTAVETIKIQKDGGRANELAVRQFVAQHLNTQGLEVQKLQQIVEIENQLNALMGRFPQPIRRAGSIIDQQLPENSKVGVPSQLLRNRPDVQQAELELKAANADLNAARLAFLPTLTISAFTGFNAFAGSVFFNQGSLAYNLLGGLAAPVFNQKALKAGQRNSQAASLEALYSYNQAIVSGIQEVVTNLKKIENVEKTTTLKGQETLALQQAVSVSKDLFLAGYASYLEVITTQKSVLEAELELTSLKKDQFHTVIELYRSLGGGWQ